MIYEQREALAALSHDALELLFRSALASDREVSYWAARAPTVVGRVEQELLAGLSAADPEEASRAVTELVALAAPELIGRLAGPARAGGQAGRGAAAAAAGQLEAEQRLADSRNGVAGDS